MAVFEVKHELIRRDIFDINVKGRRLIYMMGDQ